MAWIESHQSLRNHPKTSLLGKRLKINRAQTIGHLHLLWWWCCDYAKDGRLDRYTPDQIAEAANWEGNSGEFLQYMADIGFIDRDPLRIHDWQSYRLHFDLLQSKRERSLMQVRRRVHRWRKRNAISNAPVTQKTWPTVPTLPTVPNITNITKENPPPPLGADKAKWFQKIWEAYPKERRRGRDVAWKRFDKSVPDLETAKRCAGALEAYQRSKDVQDGFIMRGSKWFSEWKDHEPERKNYGASSHGRERVFSDFDGSSTATRVTHDRGLTSTGEILNGMRNISTIQSTNSTAGRSSGSGDVESLPNLGANQLEKESDGGKKP